MLSLTDLTSFLEKNSELIRTLEQVNMSLREGKKLDVSIGTLESIAELKAQMESMLQGRKWRNAVEHIWAFGPRRSVQPWSFVSIFKKTKRNLQFPLKTLEDPLRTFKTLVDPLRPCLWVLNV